uniref:zinc-dependent alcohol dehydrogenase n=1 Tax=Thiobacillus sp. TaxID=924 RepID=UPI00000AEF0A|nr:alcohol dehydrogenase catalytic domain-containing protein [Thiobacillus sp.]CAA07791.1 dehydrogenase [Thiobacillus sp.]
MVTKQDVEAAYLLLLGRPAEPGAAEYWMENVYHTIDLVTGLMASDEFRINRLPRLVEAGLSLSDFAPAAAPKALADNGPPMQAALHRGIGQIEVVEINRPEALPGTVVVKVGASGICGTDLRAYRQDPNSQDLPHGHEFAGTIVEVGEGVSRDRIGKRVTADLFLNAMCGNCQFCISGHAYHCIDKALPFRSGGFAEYLRVRNAATFDLPDSIDDALGALVEPLAVSTHAIRLVGVQPGMIGVVIGAGTIGLCAIAAALHAGATNVFVVARHAFQGELARAIGATDILPDDIGSAINRIREVAPHGADFVIEAVGGGQATIDQATRFLAPRGRVGIVGETGPGIKVVEAYPALMKELTFLYSNCYGYLDGKHDFEVAIENLALDGERLRKLITHEFLIADAPLAFQTANNKKFSSVKVQLKP